MRILLGLSGGLDSTYAAYALQRQGHEVEGAVLLMHDYSSVNEARESAESLGIPLHIIDCREAFEDIVIENFVSEYSKARTPNPCVICNRDVKFYYLLKYAKENGFDKIATGHYAGIKKLTDADGDYYGVVRGADTKKDQTYMLWRLSQDELASLIFPLEKLCKTEIREESRDIGFLAAERADSQEICFLPDGDYTEFIEQRIGKSPRGNFVKDDGTVLGEHKGIIHYTVGQRRGLGISSTSRIFVTKIDPETNTVVLSNKDSFANRVHISGIIYSGMREAKDGEVRELLVKLRYAAPPASARVMFFKDRAEILLNEPVRAVTPGQSAVMYDGNLLVAGGFIDSADFC